MELNEKKLASKPKSLERFGRFFSQKYSKPTISSPNSGPPTSSSYYPPFTCGNEAQRLTRHSSSLVGPSPSVDPPPVSAYRLHTATSPTDQLHGEAGYGVSQAEGEYRPVGRDCFLPDNIFESRGTRYSFDALIRARPAMTSSPTPSLMPSESPLPTSANVAYNRNHPYSESYAVPSGGMVQTERGSVDQFFGLEPPADAVFQAETNRDGSQRVAAGTAGATNEFGRSLLQQTSMPEIPEFPAMRQEANTATWDVPASNIRSLLPPVSNGPMISPGVLNTGQQWNNFGSSNSRGDSPPPINPLHAVNSRRDATRNYYDVTKPTCSLNLVCYRSGADGCNLQQVQCALRYKFPSDESFQSMIKDSPHLVYTDEEFFIDMQQSFETKMCGFFRRYFSLKTLTAFRVLVYSPTTRPAVVPFDDFVLQEMMYAYRNPSKLQTSDEWIQWVFRLRRENKRHAVEFVEGWNTTRIAIAGTIPWLSSCLVGICWTAAGGDPQTVFTVASFILTSSSIVLALLAIISSIESSGRVIK